MSDLNAAEITAIKQAISDTLCSNYFFEEKLGFRDVFFHYKQQQQKKWMMPSAAKSWISPSFTQPVH